MKVSKIIKFLSNTNVGNEVIKNLIFRVAVCEDIDLPIITVITEYQKELLERELFE